MARKVDVPGAGQAKIINPWVAFLLALVTLGIYYIFWFGIRNSELNDYGESFRGEENPLRVNVFLAIVANTIGWFVIVPPFRSLPGSITASATSPASCSTSSHSSCCRSRFRTPSTT
ncbi:MAG: DUF4234 domain-containing protein [Actinobacteria bacterium]|nr:MAG: DUF4234 domain-containing protein [Actinomycetota bacterium]